MKPPPQNDLPPSLRPGIFGGHFITFRRNPTGFLTKLSQLGDVTYFRMGSVPGYFINHPDMARDILVVNAHKFKKGRALQRAKRLLGEGLLTNEGESHLRQRRMIQPAFHRQRIAAYAETMVHYADLMAGKWQDGEIRDIDKEMMQLTLQIVGQTLFSADVEDEADGVGQAMTTIIELFNFLLLPFSEWLEKLPLPHSKRFNRARDTLNTVIYGIINERRKSGEDKGDLLSMLLLAQDEDDGTGMTDEEVRDEALTLFLAGHETTANALTFAWYLLSQNTEAEAKLHDEIDTVLNGRIPTVEDVTNLKYTESVVAEAMRLYPPAWAIGRLLLEEHTIGGYTLPKKCTRAAQPVYHSAGYQILARCGQVYPRALGKPGCQRGWPEIHLLPVRRRSSAVYRREFCLDRSDTVGRHAGAKMEAAAGSGQKIGLHPMITLRPKYGMKMTIHSRG